MKIHTGEKSFTCSVCAKKFRQKGHLDSHLKGVHFGIKEFKCSFCEKNFTTMSKKKSHELIHLERVHHGCTMCEKSFYLIIQ